jgi:hypothetical protein
MDATALLLVGGVLFLFAFYAGCSIGRCYGYKKARKEWESVCGPRPSIPSGYRELW